MGDLTKAKISQENVSDSRQLTTLIKELQNSMRSLQSVDDYLTRVSKAKEILGNDLDSLSDDIDKKKTDLNDSLIQMGRFVSSVLDSIEITEDELDSAAEQLVLFTQGKDDAITYAKKELKSQVEDSYWHKYWTGVVQRLTS
jgi:ABC-type transporter Mla subunit MlaD